MTSSAPLLEVVDLTTHFETSGGLVRAVDGVSFSLEQGRTLGVVGESGSGKTVLARSVMGLPSTGDAVRSGQVLFDGRDLMALGPNDLRRVWGVEVSMVFQDPMTSLNPVMRVGKQVTEGLRKRLSMDRRSAEQRAVELLRSVGIPAPERRLREYPQQLSGGMRQRVMVAMALACGPKLLLADEPTTSLDVTIQAQILDLLHEQQRDRFMAMILVSHDLGVVAGRTDSIAVMYAGKIVEMAPTDELFGNVKMPYTEALIDSIPVISNPPHTVLETIGGRPPNLLDPPRGCRFAARCRYAQPRCVEEAPPLTATPDSGGQHVFACWYPVGSSEYEAVEPRVSQVPAVGVAAGRVPEEGRGGR